MTWSMPKHIAMPHVREDRHSPLAREVADRVRILSDQVPWLREYYIVIGGDGHFLQTVLETWQDGRPYLGINTGHRGYLLNDTALLEHLAETAQSALHHTDVPLLEVTLCRENGSCDTVLGFNDAWIEREGAQTAWLRVSIDEKVVVAKMVADGALVATPAGSSAYAMAMGAPPLPLDAQALVFVGSNISEPRGMRPALLPRQAVVRLESIGGKKRPVRAIVDGREYGGATALEVRMHPTASVRLAFVEQYALHHKLLRLQFPQE
jgi:NAD+ kinase